MERGVAMTSELASDTMALRNVSEIATASAEGKRGSEELALLKPSPPEEGRMSADRQSCQHQCPLFVGPWDGKDREPEGLEVWTSAAELPWASATSMELQASARASCKQRSSRCLSSSSAQRPLMSAWASCREWPAGSDTAGGPLAMIANLDSACSKHTSARTSLHARLRRSQASACSSRRSSCCFSPHRSTNSGRSPSGPIVPVACDPWMPRLMLAKHPRRRAAACRRI
mmetsp:Transcript_49819/g.159335  ORF Transcript_49819/g.159335 Transcript_49819/m.159335 type:complete len:230 (-) Transcript_49819:435-1124(-)